VTTRDSQLIVLVRKTQDIYHVRVRHIKTIELSRCPNGRDFIETLPGHHLNEWVGHEISVISVDVSGLDVGQRMRKLNSWGIWKSVCHQHGEHFKLKMVIPT
jgi:hypothetical protein